MQGEQVLEVPIQYLDPELAPPAYATAGDAGADVRARVSVRLLPGERALVPTGIAVAIPFGYVGFINPRSGLAVRAGLSVVNAPGTIDAGYRGEIQVPLINLDPHEAIEISRGDRIAQLVILPVLRAQFQQVAHLPSSDRGTGGFGSTGVQEQGLE